MAEAATDICEFLCECTLSIVGEILRSKDVCGIPRYICAYILKFIRVCQLFSKVYVPFPTVMTAFESFVEKLLTRV